MTRNKVVKFNDPNIEKLLLDTGINHDCSLYDFRHVHGRIEAPCQIAGTKIRHDFSFGAFSYITGGFLFHTHVGRYCSLSNGLHIGQEGHPTDWLSTNPFQYQRGPFLLGNQFEDRGLYDQDAKRTDPRLAERLRNQCRRTVIGNDVWLAHGVYIKNGVTIGDGAIIGARSVVTQDIPPYAIAYGSPARVAKYRFPEDIVERLLESTWWQYAPWQMRHIAFDDIERAVDQLEELKVSGVEPYRPQYVDIVR